jgi:NADH:ubiquinone oxidoreductase subunit 5 (subunit L)/multisubunit Na+/H+ antiporter MnhA subunit
MTDLEFNFKYDLSKIIAPSTLSLLGLMIGAVSAGFVGLAFLAHASFKALLFMLYH